MNNSWLTLPEKPPFVLWSRKLKQLINHYGAQKIADEVFNLEYFPYTSPHFGCNTFVIESQKYTFYLLEEALKRNAIIILMRGKLCQFTSSFARVVFPAKGNPHKIYKYGFIMLLSSFLTA